MQVAEVRERVRNLVTGNGSIHSEGLSYKKLNIGAATSQKSKAECHMPLSGYRSGDFFVGQRVTYEPQTR